MLRKFHLSMFAEIEVLSMLPKEFRRAEEVA